jgi:hypothetical protein
MPRLMMLPELAMVWCSETVSNSHRGGNFVGKVGRLPMSMLPSKFAVDYVTPRQDQAMRGTCWDFATIGFLEQSYRENGIKNGWLERDEYVAFSECCLLRAGLRCRDLEVVHGLRRFTAAKGLSRGR